MNYRLRSSSFEERLRWSRRRHWVLIFFIVVVVFIFTLPWVRAFFLDLSGFGLKAERQAESVMGRAFALLRSKTSLLDEVAELKSTIAQTEFNRYLLQTLEVENEELKRLLNKHNDNIETVLAAVLQKPPRTAFDTLLIDAGSADGVVVGDVVIADGSLYIGIVSEVGRHTSQVELYSSPDIKTTVLVGPESQTAEAVGQGGGNFTIALPREMEITEGDIVRLPSIIANVFGVVSVVEARDQDAFQIVRFRSPLNLQNLVWVEVVLQ